jgi:hypothetical protein
VSEGRRYADSAFDDFWAAYPRKVGRLAAKREWDKIRPDEDLVRRIAAALEWQRETWSDPQYIPHPRTWLHQGRWDDEPPLPAVVKRETPKNLMGIEEWMRKRASGE